MHPDLIATAAHLHIAELAADAAEHRRGRLARRRLRTRLGFALVRLGTRLAPAGVTVSAPAVKLAR